MKILLLEDDITLSGGIVAAFRQDGFEFVCAYTVGEAGKALNDQIFDLLIFDVNLPDGSGMELCREVRRGLPTPTILLTVKDMETDIVSGLDAGADDYITKPFTLMVLRARVNALLRRLGEKGGEGGAVYDRPPFRFCFDRMEFSRNGVMIELSKTEQKLLRLVIMNRNRIMSRDMLIDRIWTDGSEYVDENALSVTVKRLREKLEDNPSSPVYIKNVYGQGYKWEDE